MNENAPETLTVLPHPALFRAARWTQRVCIGVSAIAILFGLIPALGLGAGEFAIASARARLPILLAGLLCGVSLLLSEPDHSGIAVFHARRAANVLVIFAAAVVIFWTRATAAISNPMHQAAPPARLALGFVMLALAVVLVDNENWLINRAVDVLVCGLCLLAVLMVSNALFGLFALFGRTTGTQSAGAALMCLLALTVAVTLRQAEHGVFSIFLGAGIGSNLARIFAPILLVLSFAWEAANAGVAGQTSAELIAAAGVAVSVGILLFFAWRISRMENEIHDLILRDESTRLYNFRGFHMLAEHALRLAKRTNVPFSVLFIELENLGQIHAQLGQNAAAASLAEAGEILRATFRESDIKGRIGADQFAVAGRFDRAGISVAALRLEATTAARSERSGRPIPLKFSMGHVTTEDPEAHETLKELLARAGQTKNRLDFQIREMRVN